MSILQCLLPVVSLNVDYSYLFLLARGDFPARSRAHYLTNPGKNELTTRNGNAGCMQNNC